MMKSVETALESLALVHMPDPLWAARWRKIFYSDLGSDRDMGLRAPAKRTHSKLVTNFPIRVFGVIMISQLCSGKVLVNKQNIEAAEARVSSGRRLLRSSAYVPMAGT
jgi:hypothetical protein